MRALGEEPAVEFSANQILCGKNGIDAFSDIHGQNQSVIHMKRLHVTRSSASEIDSGVRVNHQGVESEPQVEAIAELFYFHQRT